MNTGFLGRDGFIWFVGVIEDRHDPEKLGRVKVRALGYHTADKQKIKTADLPWAEVMQPTGGNAIGGIGDSPIGIVEGSWVVGFFRDPIALQEPIIMGTLPGRNTKPAEWLKALGKGAGNFNDEISDYEYGFFDPTVDFDSMPFEPATGTYTGTGSGGTVTTVSADKDIKVRSYKELEDDKEKLKTGKATVSTHSDGLLDTFKTTRRLTVPASYDSGTNYGDATSPTSLKRDPTQASISKIVSTGYLEDKDTRTTDGASWPIMTELESRAAYPRLVKVKKKDLTESQSKTIEKLFDEGVYGWAKEWKDVKANDEVIIPRADTNRLAQGGYTISSISGGNVTLASWGRKSKPKIAKGDKVQISGVIGMEDLNGQVFTVASASLGASSGSVSTDASSEGTYVSGGVLLPEPHAVLENKANTRERQINIGGEDLTPGRDGGDGSYVAKWNQPTSRYAAVYPYNHVYESESGHIKEFDDTPGAERIHEYHRSGTYYEIDQNGMKVDYVKGDRYNISVHDDYLYVKGKVIWTGDDDILITSNEKMSLASKWRMKIASGGDIEVYSKRNINMRAEGDINMIAGGHINIEGEVQDDAHAMFKYPSGSRPKERLSRINMVAGTIEAIAPDPKGAADFAENQSAGRISFKAQSKISSRVEDGTITEEVIKGTIHEEVSEGDIKNITASGSIYADASKKIHRKAGTDIGDSSSGTWWAKASGDAALAGGPNVLLNSGGTSSVTVPADPKLPKDVLGPDLMPEVIVFQKDVVKTGATGQGSPLGIEEKFGENIRKLDK